ncbi:Putative F-box domain-containing protein [Septoria linicola]|uniref:F-box domain-containing protein n=1 Tax=Septoria linicola TaxID=215465 RepID=A0A9Q9ALX5_9PEZI|nr:Putative F-box domain-containing protein [Septoria linicola]
MEESPNDMNLPDEILEHIFVELKLLTPSVLGRQQHEHLGTPHDDHDTRARDGEVAGDVNLVENRVKLRTLASVARCSRRFERIARPLLYSVFPGQQIVISAKFLSTMLARADLASIVQSLLLREASVGDDRYPRHGYAAWINGISHEPLYRELAHFYGKTWYRTGGPGIEDLEFLSFFYSARG